MHGVSAKDLGTELEELVKQADEHCLNQRTRDFCHVPLDVTWEACPHTACFQRYIRVVNRHCEIMAKDKQATRFMERLRRFLGEV